MFDLEGISIPHFIPGRIRVRIQQLKDNDELAENIRNYTSEMEFVEKLEINTLTGSVLIEYDSGQKEEIKKLFEQAKNLNLIPDKIDIDQFHAILEGEKLISDFSEDVRFFFKKLNGEIKEFTGNSVTLGELIPIGLFGLGLRSLLLAESIAGPPWHTYFWYAFSTFLILNPSTKDGTNKDEELHAASS
ncbi:MAG TPA: hypothetical protein VE868_12340 [Balneolaceae bacterium]|nr:hypothetical protein [Balneolaceae bacterium]